MGYITEKTTVETKIKVIPCIKCGGENIDINDCGYSSFNVAYGRCKDCKNEIKFGCGCDIKKSTIVEEWNKANDRRILIRDYKKQISELNKKIKELSKKKKFS